MSMTASDPGQTFRVELSVAASLFHGLSDPTRLAILRRLLEGEARIVDLTSQFGLAQSTVSAHVACLRDCGLVEGRPEGRQMFYSLARPELIDVLGAAETLLELVGTRVSLCPRYGTQGGDQGPEDEGS